MSKPKPSRKINMFPRSNLGRPKGKQPKMGSGPSCSPRKAAGPHACQPGPTPWGTLMDPHLPPLSGSHPDLPRGFWSSSCPLPGGLRRHSGQGPIPPDPGGAGRRPGGPGTHWLRAQLLDSDLHPCLSRQPDERLYETFKGSRLMTLGWAGRHAPWDAAQVIDEATDRKRDKGYLSN